MGHLVKKDARREKVTRKEMFESKLYRLEVGDVIRIIIEKEAYVGFQELSV